MIEQADYVIAGGGSAGCVLANRLSQDPRNRVVLLEAGPPSDEFWVKVPAGIRNIMARPDLNWMYGTQPDATMKGRAIPWHAGKMLGGGSAINGMVYIRGTRADYDGWKAIGCTGWGWDDVLPYFRKSEDFDGDPSPAHGKGGELGVSRLRVIHPLTEPFLDACEQVGLRRILDYCEGDIDGAYVPFATQRNGLRCSAADAFIKPIQSRSNLTVLTGAVVDKVLFHDGRASGVRFIHEGRPCEITVAAEVIVCAGAMQSPGVLMRSGIGPAAHLAEHGIALVAASDEVGKNIHEHPSMPNARLVDMPTYNVANYLTYAKEGLNFLLRRRGLLTTCAVHAHAHGRTSADLEFPDIKMQLMPLWGHPEVREGKPASQVSPDGSKRFGLSINTNIMTPKSRGEIRLRSADPMDKPIIDMPMYSDHSDLERMRLGLQFANRIWEAPALARHVVGNAYPADPRQSDAAWEDQIRAYSHVGYHPVKSCRMGADAASVVDPRLRVRGVDGLRIADTSIMPVMPSANTNAPAMMVAEKCADMVLADRR